jgi:hypothetical protein
VVGAAGEAGVEGAGAAVVGEGAGGLGDPLADALGDPLADALGDPDADVCAEAEEEAAVLPVLLVTHPTTVMITTKASGGAAIKNGVRRQKRFDPSRLLPGCPAGPGGGRPSGLSGLPGGCPLLIRSPKRHDEMKCNVPYVKLFKLTAR